MLNFSALVLMLLVALSNFSVQFPINEWLTWGAFVYPFTFLVTELVNRFYGPAMARRVVYFGFISAILASLLLFPFRIGCASCVAFLVSQLLDIHLFNRLRVLDWWKAPFFASLLATWIDTWVFFFLGFYGEPFPWVTLALGDFFLKFGIDLVCLFLFRAMLSLRPSKA